jgi:O-antigen/teichoic acid export membrane protein
MTPRPTTNTDSKAPPVASDGQRALHGGLWIATSKFVPLIGTALLSISIGRVLGAQLLGLQNLVAFVDALLATAVQWVLITLSIRLLSQAHGAQDRNVGTLVRQAFLINVVGGTVSGLVLAGIAWGSDAPEVWLWAATGAALNGVAWGYGVNVVAQHGWAPVARRRLVTQLLAVGLGLVAVFTGAGIAGVFASIAVAAAVFAVLMRHQHGRLPRAALTPLPSGVLRLWATLAAVEVLIQLVAQKSEVLFLQWWTTSAEVAMFSVAFMVVASAVALPVAVAVAGLPSVAASLGAGTIERTTRRLRHPVRLALALSVPLTAVVASVGPPAVLALYGQEFAPAAQIVPAMSLSMLSATAGMVCVTFWIGADRLRGPIIAAGIAVVVDIGAAVRLIPQWHLWGAVWANVAGQTTMALLMLVWTRYQGARLRVDLWRWIALVGVGIAMVSASHLLAATIGTETGGQRWLGLCAVGVSVVLVLAVVGATAGLIDPRDVPWLRTALPANLAPMLRWIAGRAVTGQPTQVPEEASTHG